MGDFRLICSDRVKKRRADLRYSLRDLAEKVNLSRQGISRIENGEGGKAQIKMDNLAPLATALQCSKLYLTGETEDIMGTIRTIDGKKVELVTPIIKCDFVEGLTARVRGLGNKDAELLNLFLEIMKRMKPDDKEFLVAFLKTFPSYKKYEKARKGSSAEYIIAELYEDSFNKKIYETIYDVVREEDVKVIKKKKLTKEEFVDQMQSEFGDKILDFTKQEIQKILNSSFERIYPPFRVRKGPGARTVQKE